MKERWDLNRRAVRLLCHLDRKYFLCTLFSSLTTAIAPYIPIYFSAKIIDALTDGAGGKTLALYAALTVGLTALVGLAGALLKMHADVGEAELDRLVDWKHAEKAMDLPYALIEDRKTALLRERIEMETQTGYNVYYYRPCYQRPYGHFGYSRACGKMQETGIYRKEIGRAHV